LSLFLAPEKGRDWSPPEREGKVVGTIFLIENRDAGVLPKGRVEYPTTISLLKELQCGEKLVNLAKRWFNVD